MSEKKKWFKVPPELADGNSWQILDGDARVLAEVLSVWLQESEAGDLVEIECVEMTEAEVAALPEI